jgi:hypothetical protein
MSKHHPEGSMITARNRNLRGASFKLTHREGKLKLTPCKLVRDGDSEYKCIVKCLQTTNEPRQKSKIYNRTEWELEINIKKTFLSYVNYVFILKALKAVRPYQKMGFE